MAPTNLTRLIRLIAVLSLAVAAPTTGCGGRSGGSDLAGKIIRYQVEFHGSPATGTATRALFISYATEDGPREQQDVGLPWTTVVSPTSSRFTASVKAQFYGFGTIVCRILADDSLVDMQTSMEEPYPTVACKT